MIGWSVTFLIIALIAGVLGFCGTSGESVDVAWVLFWTGLVLAVVCFLASRSRRFDL